MYANPRLHELSVEAQTATGPRRAEIRREGFEIATADVIKAGQRLAAARAELAAARAEADDAIFEAYVHGLSEAKIADMIGVTRMTVRRSLGK